MKYFSGFLLIAAALYGQTPAPAPKLKPGLYAIFDTSEGKITAQLFEKYTRNTVNNFVALAQGTKAWRDPKTGALVKRPLYNGIYFHRVVREEMIQAGDPSGVSANCGVTIPDEFLPGLRFDQPGRLAMANTGQPDSGGCQFFITDQAINTWNGKYTIFGQVVAGMDVEAKINRKPLYGDRPVDKIRLNSVTIERVP
ncbi:MAG: peptidylprolyl isomerase [Acidobacteriota bacterium]|nr:peptidylprolyl isomerase [Acidobacteriota bacterium]